MEMRNLISYEDFCSESGYDYKNIAKTSAIGAGAGALLAGAGTMYANHRRNKENGTKGGLMKGVGKSALALGAAGAVSGAVVGNTLSKK